MSPLRRANAAQRVHLNMGASSVSSTSDVAPRCSVLRDSGAGSRPRAGPTPGVNDRLAKKGGAGARAVTAAGGLDQFREGRAAVDDEAWEAICQMREMARRVTAHRAACSPLPPKCASRDHRVSPMRAGFSYPDQVGPCGRGQAHKRRRADPHSKVELPIGRVLAQPV
jgi:hypothetical protein